MEPHFERISPRRDVVGATEGREEIVKSVFVGQINDRQLGTPRILFPPKQVVVAEGEIKQMPGRDRSPPGAKLKQFYNVVQYPGV